MGADPHALFTLYPPRHPRPPPPPPSSPPDLIGGLPVLPLDYRVKPDNDGKVRVGQVWVCYNFLHDRRQAERYVRRSGDR